MSKEFEKEGVITRAYNFEIRAENNDKNGDHITGRPIVYDERTNLGWFDEIIVNGALEDTDLKDVRFLVNHNTDMIPLARSRNNNENSTMQLSPDKKGLGMRANLDTVNNSDARNLYSAVGRGDVSGMSFMFTIDQERWEDLDTDHPTRFILKIGKVFEVSAVTFPAYEATEISARDKKALESAKAALESAKRSLESDNKAELELEKAKNDNRLI